MATLITNLTAHTQQIYTVVTLPNGKVLSASSSPDLTLKIWDPNTWSLNLSLPVSSPVRAIEPTLFAIGDEVGKITFLDPNTYSTISTITLPVSGSVVFNLLKISNTYMAVGTNKG